MTTDASINFNNSEFSIHSQCLRDDDYENFSKINIGPSLHSRKDLLTTQFYKQDHWIDEFCEILFKVKQRKSTIKLEIYYGLIHFISCLFVLVVVPDQLSKAQYHVDSTVVAVGLTCGIGNIIGGLFTNLPFILAPTTAVSIYLATSLQEDNIGYSYGSTAVILSGFPIILLFYRPVGTFVSKLIPLPIQVGTTLGIGLLTALAGAVEVDLIQNGKYALLQLGPITFSIILCIGGVIIIAAGLFHQIKGIFVIVLISCSLIWWAYSNEWPTHILSTPSLSIINSFDFNLDVFILTVDLSFLYVLFLSGLIPAFTELSELEKENGSTPRGRWLYIISGIVTIVAGVFTSAPVLISPESTAGIKAGAKTGLSTFVCGVLFLISIFFAPLFQAVPPAATSPLLLSIGIILFGNVNRINWKNIEDAAPAFIVLFVIPMSYNIYQGVIMGYIVYLVMGIFTGSINIRTIDLISYYYPQINKKTSDIEQSILMNSEVESDNKANFKENALLSSVYSGDSKSEDENLTQIARSASTDSDIINESNNWQVDSTNQLLCVYERDTVKSIQKPIMSV